MRLRSFAKVGHLPSLFSAFLYFDISFMVWVLLGALANSIVQEFALSPAAKGLLVAMPLLGGAALRVVLGVMVDQWGARRVGLLALTVTILPLLLAWRWADSFPQLLVVAALLGIAGASFAVALPLASRWYPPQYQGLALGIAGAGNSGTALATFFAPRLAEVYGWRAVFGLALIPVIAALLVFYTCAKDSPQQPPSKPLRDYLKVFRTADCRWFCAFYSVTFGGFVGLASFLGVFFHDQFGLDKVAAGSFTTLCVVAGSALRPVGGYLADRFGGTRLLLLLYLGAMVWLAALSLLPPLGIATGFMFLTMAFLGMGNGAVFQLVPQRFPRDIGVVTGIVGAAGGVGGFFLPLILGSARQSTGSYASGLALLTLVCLGSAIGIKLRGRVWRAGATTTSPLALEA